MRYALVAAVLLLATPAAAQQCSRADVMAHTLRDGLGQQLRYEGLAESGVLVQVYVSRDGNWTFLGVMPNGMACVVGRGEGWATAVEKGGQES